MVTLLLSLLLLPLPQLVQLLRLRMGCLLAVRLVGLLLLPLHVCL